MILYIDTTESETEIKLFDHKVDLVDKIVFDGTGILSEELISKIETLLTKNQLNKNDLFAIAVNPGPGSYTGVRIGVTTGNLIAFALNIPIIKVQKPQDIKRNIGKLSINKLFVSPVLPLYKYPPRITKKKMD